MKFIDEIGMARLLRGFVNPLEKDSSALIYLFLLHSIRNMSNPKSMKNVVTKI